MPTVGQSCVTASIKLSAPGRPSRSATPTAPPLFLNIDDDLGFAQLFGEAGMVAEQLVVFVLQRIAFGFGTALLRCQSLAYAGFALAPPGRQQRRVQPLPAEQCSDAAEAFGLVGFRQNVVFVLGGEAAAFSLSDDFRVSVDCAGAGIRGT